MKGLNKIALVAAIAAAPLAANAELTALNDSTMSNLTGQAGVTIELQTKIDIGDVVYTDEGSLHVTGVHVGGGSVAADGSSVSGNLDDLVATIDIDAEGDAIIDVHSGSGNPIDFAIGVESVSLQGTTDSTVLASKIGVTGSLGALNLTVDTATDTLIATVGFSVDNLDMDVDFLAVGIRGLSLHGAGFNTAPSAANNFASVIATVGSVANTNASSGKALNIGLSTFSADINIAGLEIGGTSIGSLQMNGLEISNTSLQVYGH